MAVHADLRGWHSGEGRFFDGCVTVAAIQTEAGHVMLMTEGNRLGRPNSDVCQVGRASDSNRYPRNSGEQENKTENADPRKSIGAAMEYPGHWSIVVCPPRTHRGHIFPTAMNWKWDRRGIRERDSYLSVVSRTHTNPN